MTKKEIANVKEIANQEIVTVKEIETEIVNAKGNGKENESGKKRRRGNENVNASVNVKENESETVTGSVNGKGNVSGSAREIGSGNVTAIEKKGTGNRNVISCERRKWTKRTKKGKNKKGKPEKKKQLIK